VCFKPDKWKDFEVTPEYLLEVGKLDTVEKLYLYTRWFNFIADIGDTWKTPIELLNDKFGDCEDFGIWYTDILTRVIKIDGARLVIYAGLNLRKEFTGHGVCVFPYKGKLAMFTNNIPPILGFKDFIEAGHYFYPNGLKYMEIRDWNGKITCKKRKWIGVF